MTTDARSAAPDEPALKLASAKGRWVLWTTIAASGMASLDATVVNIALPHIETSLGGGVAALQWTVNAYTLTLAGFLLLGGSLGDRVGRRRMLVVGAAWFTAASALCAMAPSSELLIAGRALQGIGGALLTPGSLAILEASFAEEDRAAAIGSWSAFAGVATAFAPFIGGWLIEAASWRYIFVLNLPIGALVVAAAIRHVPETRDPDATGRLDVLGTLLGAAGLAGVVYALTEGVAKGWGDPAVLACGLGGVTALLLFVVVETRAEQPILPLGIFSSHQFAGANAVTFLVYGALGASFCLLPIELQRVLHYSPVVAGASLAPVTVIMLALSKRMGRVSTKIGPRLPMTLGPAMAALGMLLLSRAGGGASYLGSVLPGIVVFGLGLSITVAPLTATVLAAAPAQHAGAASAVNNDVARTAQLLAVAVIPVAAGITTASYDHALLLARGFQHGLWIVTALLAAGAALAAVTIRRPLVPVAPTPLRCAIAEPSGPAMPQSEPVR